ncbi:hypothetical protein ONZ45_g13258 [Pleurotus djamor]|nr:hypothetical protein ONZ45_g13258 [Pleurotus djamor]
MTSAFSRIPEELVSTIAGHLSETGAGCAACSLVCRSWTYPFQQRVFSNIRIALSASSSPLQQSQSRVSRFVNILRTSPFIGMHVEVLEIVLCHNDFSANQADLRDVSSTLEEQEKMAIALSYMKRLSTLVLNGLILNMIQARFNPSLPLLNALRERIKDSSFSGLGLQGMCFSKAFPLVHLGKPIPSLAQLCLTNVIFDGDITDHIPEDTDPIHDHSRREVPTIASLSIGHSSIDLSDLIQIFGSFRIKSLAANCGAHLEAARRNHLIATSIEELGIHFCRGQCLFVHVLGLEF